MSTHVTISNVSICSNSHNPKQIEEGKIMEKIEQNAVRITCKLPQDMRPNQQAFEAVGFSFDEFWHNELCRATLPEGWKIEHEKQSSGVFSRLFDEKGRIRALSCHCYNLRGDVVSGNMSLIRRFKIGDEEIDENDPEGPLQVLVRDFDGSVIYNAGQYFDIHSTESDIAFKKATDYLDANYPEWRDPTKYWDQ